MRRPTAIALAGILVALLIADVDAKIRLHTKNDCCIDIERRYGCASGDCSTNVGSLAGFSCMTCSSSQFCTDGGTCKIPNPYSSSDCCIGGNGDAQQYCNNGECNSNPELVNVSTSDSCDFCGDTICGFNGACVGSDEFCYYSDFSCKDFVEHLPWILPVSIVGFVLLVWVAVCCCICRAKRNMRNRPVTVEVTSVWLFWRRQPLQQDQEYEKPPPPYQRNVPSS